MKNNNVAGMVDLRELDELANVGGDVQAQTSPATPSIATTLVSIMTIEATATYTASMDNGLNK